MLYPIRFTREPLHPQSTDFAVIIKDDIVGKGTISYRDFDAGTIIALMAGDIVDDIRQHTLQISPNKHLFDPFFSGYFLHSCDPNISLDMQSMTVTALKPIAANSFLYMDYAQTEDHLFKQFPCSCGADNCRGWVSGRLDNNVLNHHDAHLTLNLTENAL